MRLRRPIPITVIPAQAGIQRARVCAPKRHFFSARPARDWIPASAGMTARRYPSVIPATQTSAIVHAPRPMMGAFARRCRSGTRRGARGFGSQPNTRAAPGLRPGPIRGPARSWLKSLISRYRPSAWLSGHQRLKARPGGLAQKSPRCGAPEGARRIRQRIRTPSVCAFRRAIPLASRSSERREALARLFCLTGRASHKRRYGLADAGS
jgi:hypothetical protein